MKDLKEKRVSVALIVTALIFAFQAIDVFLIKSDGTIFADTIVARILGLITVIVAAKMLKFNIRRRCLNSYGWYFELLYGVGFSIAPLIVIYVSELVYFRIKGFYKDVSIFMLASDGRDSNLLLPLAVYAFALLFNVLFKEIYRGFMLYQLGKKLGAKWANVLQASICTLMSLIYVVRAFAENSFSGSKTVDIVITILASTAATFISSMRWGYYYKVNGSIWMAIADHFVNTFVLTSIFFSPDRLPDKWLLIKSLVIQVISCVIFIPFYYKRDRVNAEYVKEMKTRHDVLSAMNESEENLDEETASNNFMMMMNESEQSKRFGRIKENEILDFDRKPREYSKGVLGTDSGRTEKERKSSDEHKKSGSGKKRRMRSTESVPESAESISKLVDEYFKKNFDKHTYN